MKAKLASCSFAVLAMVASSFAQSLGTTVTQEMRTEANQFFQASDWTKAAVAYEKIVEIEEKNTGARYRLGVSLLGGGKNAEAQRHLETAFTASPNPVFALALARAYVRNGAKERAYEILERSLTLGGISPDTMNSEPDFAGIKVEQRFADLVRRSDIVANPCKASPEFRQFDFWIGEWDAKNAQGVTVGSSSIQLILGQCIIFENWSTPVSSGKSFNIYNSSDKKWHQSWVDDKGTFTHYIGGIVDGKMVLDSEKVVGGKKTIARMTFSRFPNGDVRQHGENSSDDGKTWATSFEFIYVRKK